SKTLINDPRERLGLAELNLQAGDRAKHSNAFESASQYYNTALSLLPENSWTEHYSTMFHLYSELGMCEYLKLNFEQAESFFNTALENAGSNFDQASLYNHMAEIIANQGKHQEAVRLYMKGLEKNHVRFNSNPGQLAIIFHLFSSRLKMLGKEPAELTNLPALNDRETQLTLKLLMNCINSAFFSDKNKFAYFILKAFQINLTYGNCFISPFVFFTYGAIYVTGLKKYKTGIEFADIALQINKEYFDPTVKTRLYCLYGVSMSIWKEHLYNSLDYLDQALKLAFQNGETRYAVYTQQSIVFTMLALGSALNELEDFSNKYFDFIMQSRDKGAISYNLTVRQLINALKDKTRGRTSLDDEEFDEAGHVEKMLAEDIPIVNHRHYLHKAMLCYLFNELEAALENIQISDRYLESSGGTICEPEHYFYQSLIITSLVRKEPSTYKNKLSKVRKNLKLLKKWAGLCPSNFRHKDYLIRAELADLEQDSKMAMDCYYTAIADAKENDFLLNNALANELFARFFARGGMFDLAEIYFSRAQFVYNHFGAIAKVGQLQELYPDYLTSAYQEPIFDPNKSNPHSLSGTSSSVPEIYSFDALSVTRAAQILSREIELDKLLEKSMKTILENAGAQRGVLVTQEEKSNKLYIEAEGEIDRPITLHQFLLLEDFDQVPHNIINYIFKTNEDVIINDLAREDNFANDPYLSKNRVGSLLCMPIRYKGYTTGVFYLENRLSSNVFTPERLQVLRMLISQVAISLDNAQLYKKAITDDLTELVTHNHFKFMLEKEVERSQRYKRQFSLIMFDIDNFKQINDIYGHLAGDEILLNLSSLAREEFRSADLIARYGGEEFTIILTETDYQGAYSAAERFRELIDGYTSWNVDFDPHITVSIGMSSFPQHGTSARAIIDSADQALYASKRAGRNKTTIYKKTSGESLLNVNFSGED
ncbi:MAG: diguanylate cyclase, partial [Thermodesulfobacteriota bacterium]